MQMLCIHFSNPVTATNERIIIWTFLGFEEECAFLSFFFFYHYMGMIADRACPFEQTLNPVSTIRSTWNFVEIGEVVSEEKLFNNLMILYTYLAQEHDKITLTE